MRRTSTWRRASGVVRCLAAALLVVSAGGGCINPAALLNPQLLSALGLGQPVARLPGEAPAIVLALENRTDFVVQMRVSYRDVNDAAQSFTQLITARDRSAQAVICPVREITLGDVANLTQIGAIVRLGEGLPTDPVIEVEPFGVLLRDGANYDCGDSVTFAVQPSGATRSGFQVFAYIQRAGVNQ